MGKARVCLGERAYAAFMGVPMKTPWAGAYLVLTVMTHVVAPNEECDQLPVVL